MVWLKKDDGYNLHRKVKPLTDAAYRLEDEALLWTARNGTDGHIPADDLPHVSEVRKHLEAAAELVKRGRWHLPGHDCDSEFCRPIEDGYLIHDFLDYNPAAEKVRKVREARAIAGSVGGKRSGKTRANLKAVGDHDA